MDEERVRVSLTKGELRIIMDAVGAYAGPEVDVLMNKLEALKEQFTHERDPNAQTQ